MSNEAQKKEFFIKKVKEICSRWFITAFSGMAQGLFCTLIAGTILAQIASWIGLSNYFGKTLNTIASIAKSLMGAGIGVGIAFSLKKSKLLIFSAAVAGFVGAFSDKLIFGGTGLTVLNLGAPGNPIGAYVATMLVVEIVELYAGKTKLDIILIPIGTLLLSFAGVYVAWPFVKLIDLFASLLVILINAGSAIKVITGIVIAIVMGILLTMPTSSAAIWLAIAGSNTALSNPEVFAIAGGAAVAGCAAHMVGFAVASFKENGVSGLISQGIGTSMLQIPNIMKKPIIMLPQIISSAVCGLVAVLLDMRCNAAGGGMGTSGLVGVFGVIDASATIPPLQMILAIALTMFILPTVISYFTTLFMRKKGWIKDGDMKLD
ncbi:MAG: PTS sugar transporter subunit IIC [Clostridia bacterium]|nr:PTS sugar transporter subunit IIC [Clostridia bacterium]